MSADNWDRLKLRKLTDAELARVKDFRRAMEHEVIPETLRILKLREQWWRERYGR